MNSRRREMLSWAINNLTEWPHGIYDPPQPCDINCKWEWNEGQSSLPVLCCCSYGWVVSSVDFFYAKGVK